MTLTPMQISAIRRVLDELADADGKRYRSFSDEEPPRLALAMVADHALISADMAVHENTDTRLGYVDADQQLLLQLHYIRRRVNIEIDRLEERAIEGRED